MSSYSGIQELSQVIRDMCEKEDIRGSGRVDKFVILELLRKYTGEEHLQLDEELVREDEVDYLRLLS